MVDEAVVRGLLTEVLDPEIGLDVVELGLVYGIDASPEGVRVVMTLTSAACPMGEMIVDHAHRTLTAGLPAGVPVELEVVWEPPWSPDRMSVGARRSLGWAA